MSNNTKDTVVSTSDLHQTNDYKKFKTIAGNRLEDKQHTRALIRKIEKEGNLTQYFPIIVNERMEIIDGLHRLRALEGLGYPVFYEIKSGLNVDSVISFNTGTKNWNWQDYAHSWMERGNKNYAQLLELYDMYKDTKVRFGTLMYYLSGGRDAMKHQATTYKEGNFIVKDFDSARKLLGQYYEIVDAAGHNTREFSYAMNKYMRTPKYDHQKMIQKAATYGDRLERCYSVYDYLSALEEIYKA